MSYRHISTFKAQRYNIKLFFYKLYYYLYFILCNSILTLFRKAISLDDCEICPVGSYCDGDALDKTSTEIQSEFPCEKGYYCPEGSTSQFGANQAAEYHICAPGHQCPESSSAETDCQIGEYQHYHGKEKCEKCEAGYVCNETNMTEPEICPEGFYCIGGNAQPEGCEPGIK